jgi:hypothetical protein
MNNRHRLLLMATAAALINGGCAIERALDYNYRNGNTAMAWHPTEPSFVEPLAKKDAIDPRVLADMDNAVKGVVFPATAPAK